MQVGVRDVSRESTHTLSRERASDRDMAGSLERREIRVVRIGWIPGRWFESIVLVRNSYEGWVGGPGGAVNLQVPGQVQQWIKRLPRWGRG